MNYKIVKRIMDAISALLLLLVLSPLLIVLALLNLYFHGSPILFVQQRPGLCQKPFGLYKFRTMTNHRDKEGRLIPDHERLTSYGRFLRKTSLDELPELLNVLKGEMSLVGPRPLLMKYLPYYTDREQVRHSVRPGITGYAQVCGRNRLNWDARLEKDIEYIENMSLSMDVKILIKTITDVLQRKDIALHAIDDLDEYRRKKKRKPESV